MSTELMDRARRARLATEAAVVDVITDSASREIALGMPGLIEHVASYETRVTEHHGHIAWAASVGVEWPLTDRTVVDSEAVASPQATAPHVVPMTCGDIRDGFVCTHLAHHHGDHAETRWSGNTPRTAAFWNDGSGITGLTELVLVHP